MKLRKYRVVHRDDFREFLFTATGKATQIDQLNLLDVADNLLPELDGLRSLVGLLMTTSDEMDAEGLQGMGLILRGMEARMRRIVDEAVAVNKIMSTRGYLQE